MSMRVRVEFDWHDMYTRQLLENFEKAGEREYEGKQSRKIEKNSGHWVGTSKFPHSSAATFSGEILLTFQQIKPHPEFV